MRRQPGGAIARNVKPKPIFTELFDSIRELAESGFGRKPRLLQHLMWTFDQLKVGIDLVKRLESRQNNGLRKRGGQSGRRLHPTKRTSKTKVISARCCSAISIRAGQIVGRAMFQDLYVDNVPYADSWHPTAPRTTAH